MTCRKAQFLIQSCLDGAASRPEREAVDEHVRRCEGCAGVMEDSRKLALCMASMPVRRPGEQFEAHLRDAVRHTPPVSRSAAWWERFRLFFEWRLRLPAMAAAGALAVAVIAGMVTPQIEATVAARRDRGQFLARALERHQQLERDGGGANWEALDASGDLSAGSVITE